MAEHTSGVHHLGQTLFQEPRTQMLVSVARLKYDVTEDPNVGVCSEAKV